MPARSGRTDDLAPVFESVADPTRRQLLDRLHERSGQTPGELCASLSMARQSAPQHLAVRGCSSQRAPCRAGSRRSSRPAALSLLAVTVTESEERAPGVRRLRGRRPGPGEPRVG